MKTVTEISKLCNTSRENTYRAAQRLNIIPAKTKGRIVYYDEYQEFLILEHLFYIGKIDSLIYESKMNHVETKEEKYKQFKIFKENTYGKRN